MALSDMLHFKEDDKQSKRDIKERPKQVYVVIFTVPYRASAKEEGAYDRLWPKFGVDNVYEFKSDHVLLVSSSEGNKAREIADTLNLSGECPGVVFPLGEGYSGFEETDFWKWLEERT